jgi:hypothetical protein
MSHERDVEAKTSAARSMHAQAMIPVALTFAEGSLIFAGLLVIGVFVLAFTLYSRRGSGISRTPYADLDHASGPETPSAQTHDATEEIRNMGRGTAGHHGHRHPPPPDR